MARSDHPLHLCPTRIDLAPVLIAHKVSDGQCQDRQRGHYHKCYTCAHNNAYVAAHGKPAASTQTHEPKQRVRASAS